MPPWWISAPAVVTLLMSGVAFCAFALDKRAARRGARRTRERTLHVLELLGGWPGALLAIFTLRHKTRDGVFLLLTGASVVLHTGLWALALRAWLLRA